jgi:hypothetical protein
LSTKARFAVVCMAVTALGAGIAVAAASHVVRIDSNVTITKTAPVFAGKVRSPNAACKDQRKVKLHVVEENNHVFGSDETNRHGKWKIHFQGEGEAHYYASVAKRSEGAAGTIYVCQHDTSPPVAAP